MKDLTTVTCPHLLEQAVSRTFDKYEALGKKPGAEYWVQVSKGRTQIHADVAAEWSSLMGHETYVIPWSVDFVVYAWTHYRKTTKEGRRAWGGRQTALNYHA